MKQIRYFIMFLTLAGMMFSFSACAFNRTTSVIIEPTNVKNDYNNSKTTVSSLVVQIGDRLYYDYFTNSGMTPDGIYEISDGQCKKILSRSKRYLDSVYKGEFIDIDYNSGQVTYLDRESGKPQPYDGIKIPDNIGEFSYTICDDVVYLGTGDAVYRQTENGFEKWISSEDFSETKYIHVAYIDGDNVYYVEGDEYVQTDDGEYGAHFEYVGNGEYKICRYNVKTKKTTKIDLGEMMIITPIQEHNDAVYFLSESAPLYKADFKTNTVTKIFDDNSGSNEFVLFEDKIYVAGHVENLGIHVSEDEGKTFKKISDAYAYSVFAVDDRYVYYTDENSNLYRVTVDGTKTEKVF